MPPRPKDSAGNLRTNGNDHGGDTEPPPSTIAAVLINNLSAAQKPSRRSNEQDELKTIMDEVSLAVNGGTKLEKAEDKHKLIYVLTRSLLEKLAGDDPFMDVKSLLGQASEALDVFTVHVKEDVSILEYSTPADSTLQGRGIEPFWVWLFPRILALLGRAKCEILTDQITSFFTVSFQAVARTPRLWTLNSFFFSYLTECASSKYSPCLTLYGRLVRLLITLLFQLFLVKFKTPTWYRNTI